MATENNLIPILIKATYWSTNSIIQNKHDKFIDSDTYKVSDSGRYKDGKYQYIDSLDFLGDGKTRPYFCNNKPIWTIDFIEEISNNKRVDYSSSVIESLIESICDYTGDCKMNKFVNDVEPFFDKDFANKHGKESRNFIGLFEEWSSWDSYAGDGDYGINYIRIVDVNELLTNLNNIEKELDCLRWM
jgi:hypothetical protein